MSTGSCEALAWELSSLFVVKLFAVTKKPLLKCHVAIWLRADLDTSLSTSLPCKAVVGVSRQHYLEVY